ncbi:MAG TPA: EAL domain-containing protein [Actinomycetales bacterium]|jgi:diguanylate cyclase (GGDEF)-like protein/PAS domain S-box-containing protein
MSAEAASRTHLEGPPLQTLAAARAAEIELFSLGGRDGHLREVNASFARLLGLPVSAVNGRSLLELVHPDDLGDIVGGLAALEAGAAEVLLENRFVQSDGTFVHLQWVARPLPGTDLWWASGRDTTEFHQLVADRRDLRVRLELALGTATAGMWELDVRRGRLLFEPQATQVLGLAHDEAPAGPAQLVAAAHPDDQAAVRAALQQLVDEGSTEVSLRVGGDLAARHVSLRGRVLQRDRKGRPLRAVGLLLDITAEKAMEEQLLRMVMSDALTGVSNRRAFDQLLRSEWRRCTRAGQPLSIVMVDVDDFKRFNDAFGHLVGDEALCAVARALTGGLRRAGDVIARFGGEEFALVLPGVDREGALVVAERLVEQVRAITMRQAPRWALSVSVGTATWHPDDDPLRSVQLLARADGALFAAKAAGKDRAVAYEEFLAARAGLASDIARGLAAGEFEVYYQPKIALVTGAVIGFEALTRWNRPGHGLVPPSVFIPVAEASDLICEFGRWGMREAARQLVQWSRDGLDPHGGLHVAVNVAARHVGDAALAGDVAAVLAETGLDPARLEVELTETTLVDNVVAGEHLTQVRRLGVSVAIDDFGTGHTSVGQLVDLPVDCLKIDQSFVGSDDPQHQALLTLIIGAAHAFGLTVVAEGVEDSATLQRLRELDCDVVQGYHLGRPMPAAAATSWLAARSPAPPRG